MMNLSEMSYILSSLRAPWRSASMSVRIEGKAVKPYAIAMTEAYAFSESGLCLRENPLVCSFILRVAQMTAFIYLD